MLASPPAMDRQILDPHMSQNIYKYAAINYRYHVNKSLKWLINSSACPEDKKNCADPL